MAEVREPVRKRTRLWVVVAASLLVFLSVMNLVLVVEAAPEVEPETREGRTWQAGTGTPEQSGRHTWAFTVDPKGRHVTELAMAVPYTVRVTHVAGEATLRHTVWFEVDGERFETVSRSVSAAPQGNASERVSRTHSVTGMFDPVVRVDQETAREGFVLLVIWEWAVEQGADADVTFQTMVRPLTASPLDVGGLPGCGSGCARALLGASLVVQLGTVFWYRTAPPPPETGQKDV